jgi:hypothetical protein
MKSFTHCWMMAVLLTGICAGVIVGCYWKREVTGQVFVVTKGGENVKLGLVGIYVVGEGQLVEIGSKLLSEAGVFYSTTEVVSNQLDV